MFTRQTLTRRAFLKTALVSSTCLTTSSVFARQKTVSGKRSDPNILFFFMDDLGYGDLSIQNPDSKIKTPNMDRLAREGMRFTDAHAAAPICGPSRYGLMTGRYPWRKPDGISNGPPMGQPRIETGRMTIASMLCEAGYNTALLGKWGLRYDFRSAMKEGVTKIRSYLDLDYTKPVYGGRPFGFQYECTHLYIGPQSRVVEGKHATHYFAENGIMLGEGDKPDLKGFDYHKQLPTFTEKAVEYLEVYAGKRKNAKMGLDRKKPFFLYWTPAVPHTPCVPNQEFLGKSQAGEYGDFVVELDYSIGRILDALERTGQSQNTLVILSSDQGPENTAYRRIQDYKHYSMGNWRGLKRDSYEGGTRVPLLIRWPGKVKPGSIYKSPLCLTDFFATFGQLTQTSIPQNVGEDSFSFLQVLLGKQAGKPYRPAPIIYHLMTGQMAIRDGDWVYMDSPSGGHRNQEPEWFRRELGVKPHELLAELFNLRNDPRQTTNLYVSHPEKAAELKARLEGIKKTGRSR